MMTTPTATTQMVPAILEATCMMVRRVWIAMKRHGPGKRRTWIQSIRIWKTSLRKKQKKPKRKPSKQRRICKMTPLLAWEFCGQVNMKMGATMKRGRKKRWRRPTKMMTLPSRHTSVMKRNQVGMNRTAHWALIHMQIQQMTRKRVKSLAKRTMRRRPAVKR